MWRLHVYHNMPRPSRADVRGRQSWCATTYKWPRGCPTLHPRPYRRCSCCQSITVVLCARPPKPAVDWQCINHMYNSVIWLRKLPSVLWHAHWYPPSRASWSGASRSWRVAWARPWCPRRRRWCPPHTLTHVKFLCNYMRSTYTCGMCTCSFYALTWRQHVWLCSFYVITSNLHIYMCNMKCLCNYQTHILWSRRFYVITPKLHLSVICSVYVSSTHT